MNIRELRDRLLVIAPEARIPDGQADDLYPFRFASTAFVPPFMEVLMRVVLEADADPGTRERLDAFTSLLEDVFATGDDDLVDAFAMRVVYTRLCQWPSVLEKSWQYLGERTRQIAWKFVRLAEECDRREAAARTQAGTHGATQRSMEGVAR
jgi:hypothetical protein